MSLQKYILDLSQFKLSLPNEIRKIVKANEGKIVGMVKNRLFQYGRDGDGNEILPTYSPSTIAAKREKRQRTSHVTLRDTGLFYKGFYLELEGYDLILDSSDGKTTHLITKYGEAILEFTIQERRVIESIIDSGIEAKIRSLTFNASSAGGIDILS